MSWAIGLAAAGLGLSFLGMMQQRQQIAKMTEYRTKQNAFNASVAREKTLKKNQIFNKQLASRLKGVGFSGTPAEIAAYEYEEMKQSLDTFAVSEALTASFLAADAQNKQGQALSGFAATSLNLIGGYYQTTKQEEFYDKLSTRQDTPEG